MKAADFEHARAAAPEASRGRAFPGRARRWLDQPPRNDASPQNLPDLATALLIGLLLVDLVLICGHFVFFFSDWKEARLLLSYEGGYGELFQYAKFFALAAVFLACAATSLRWWWLTWAAVFAFMGFDDSMTLHETAARAWRGWAGYVGEGTDAPRLFGFRWQDFGEFGFVVVAGILLLVPVVLAYARADALFRATTRRLIVLLLALGVIGVVCDVIQQHAAVRPIGWLFQALIIVEDGGELLITTLTCWVVALMLLRHGGRAPGELPAASRRPA